MSTSVADAIATRSWCDDQKLWVTLDDGRELGVPLGFYPRLMHATAEQRSKVRMSGDGRALHWEELDEDLSVEGLLVGGMDQTRFGRDHHATCEACRASAGLL